MADDDQHQHYPFGRTQLIEHERAAQVAELERSTELEYQRVRGLVGLGLLAWLAICVWRSFRGVGR